MLQNYVSVFHDRKSITRQELCLLLNLNITRSGLIFVADEINRAYRARALRFHPDKQKLHSQMFSDDMCRMIMTDMNRAKQYLLMGDQQDIDLTKPVDGSPFAQLIANIKQQQLEKNSSWINFVVLHALLAFTSTNSVQFLNFLTEILKKIQKETSPLVFWMLSPLLFIVEAVIFLSNLAAQLSIRSALVALTSLRNILRDVFAVFSNTLDLFFIRSQRALISQGILWVNSLINLVLRNSVNLLLSSLHVFVITFSANNFFDVLNTQFNQWLTALFSKEGQGKMPVSQVRQTLFAERSAVFNEQDIWLDNLFTGINTQAYDISQDESNYLSSALSNID